MKLTEQDRQKLRLNDPEYVARFGKMTQEEINQIEQEFNDLLTKCKEGVIAGSIKGGDAAIMEDDLRELFCKYVAGQTEAEPWAIATDERGSQGVAELPAGQKLIKKFFRGCDYNWYDLISILQDLSDK